MEKIYQYLDMNGYSFYIWSSYGVWFFLLGLLIIKVIFRKKAIEKKIRALEKNEKYN